MPTCDMCGKESDLMKAKIEGTVLEVCEQCRRFGEMIERPAQPVERPVVPKPRYAPAPRRRELIQMVTEDYAKKIRQSREKTGLNQEQFAGRLNEKESVIQKMEAGQFTPSINLARKLERLLKIRLIEEYSEEGEVPIQTEKTKDESFTLGDFVKDKRKKD
ncbi:multiprotein bridging factor aMBF1 [Candidatus Woesearchaeota archaeon]|nr:multiprotein bridging factor aMBF1 [Candidatus Woesearchaeota archaeon]